MREDFDLLAFMLGLPTGMVPVLIVGYFVWKKGKKNRRYDERYKRVHERAMSLAWSVTMWVIVISLAIIYIFDGVGLALFLFSVVYVIGMVSYGVTAAIMEKKS